MQVKLCFWCTFNIIYMYIGHFIGSLQKKRKPKMTSTNNCQKCLYFIGFSFMTMKLKCEGWIQLGNSLYNIQFMHVKYSSKFIMTSKRCFSFTVGAEKMQIYSVYQNIVESRKWELDLHWSFYPMFKGSFADFKVFFAMSNNLLQFSTLHSVQ